MSRKLEGSVENKKFGKLVEVPRGNLGKVREVEGETNDATLDPYPEIIQRSVKLTLPRRMVTVRTYHDYDTSSCSCTLRI